MKQQDKKVQEEVRSSDRRNIVNMSDYKKKKEVLIKDKLIKEIVERAKKLRLVINGL